MNDFPCCVTGKSSDCGRIGVVNEVGPESVGSALDPALTPEIAEAGMNDTEPRPPLTDERLAEIEQWAALTPEWTGGPDWAFHAQRDRTALLAEVRASRAREAELTAMTRVNTFIGMQVDRDNERVHRRRAEGRIDVLQQRIDKALASLPDSSKYTVGAENALRVVSLLLDDIATARAALSGYAS